VKKKRQFIIFNAYLPICGNFVAIEKRLTDLMLARARDADFFRFFFG
jgi:hypothetical protein